MECRLPGWLGELGVSIRAGGDAVPRRLAVLLGVLAARNIVERGGAPCVCVGDDHGYEAFASAAERLGIRGRYLAVDELGDCEGFPVIALWPRKGVKEGLDYRFAVAPGLRPSRLGLRRITVRPLPRGGYRVRIGSYEAQLVEREGVLCEAVVEEPVVVRILREAIREYGPLPLRDAAQLVANELGVTRGEARRLILEAAGEGRVRIEAGYVVDAG